MRKHPSKKPTADGGVQEMMALYTAWIGVLLRRLGEGSYRIPLCEIKEGLGALQLSVVREEDAYIITLTDMGGKDAHDGSES